MRVGGRTDTKCDRFIGPMGYLNLSSQTHNHTKPDKKKGLMGEGGLNGAADFKFEKKFGSFSDVVGGGLP